MSDNNTGPIDPASCDVDKWWLVSVEGAGQRTARRRYPDSGLPWFVPGGGYFADDQIAVASELVRQDEAQKMADQSFAAGNAHSVSTRVDRDRWKAECEKAQAEAVRLRNANQYLLAERDELQRKNERQQNGLRQMGEELGDARKGGMLCGCFGSSMPMKPLTVPMFGAVSGMSDPAISAAQRAEANAPHRINGTPVVGPVAGAREALQPYRQRHQSLVRGPITVCKYCTGVLWPCADARNCYTTEELENQK